MALSDKAVGLLKQIYDHHRYGDEELVDENPDEALEYVLQEIVNRLTDRQLSGIPLDMLTEDAVGSLRYARGEREEAETS